MHLPLLVLLSVIGAELTHSELGVTIELPEGWRADGCGPFVPPVPECRIAGKRGPCLKTIFPSKVSRKIGARVIECAGEATTLAGRKQLIEACQSVRRVKKP